MDMEYEDNPNLCDCGSGELKESLYDARGIFCCSYCIVCEEEKRGMFRPEVLNDPNYSTDEPIDEEDY